MRRHRCWKQRALKQLALKQVIQLPKPLWREILELCGGELKSAAARAYGEEDDAN